MSVVVLWFLTLIASVIIATLFISAHLSDKHRNEIRALKREKLALARINEGLMDESLVLRQRYKTLWAETKGQNDERE